MMVHEKLVSLVKGPSTVMKYMITHVYKKSIHRHTDTNYIVCFIYKLISMFSTKFKTRKLAIFGNVAQSIKSKNT